MVVNAAVAPARAGSVPGLTAPPSRRFGAARPLRHRSAPLTTSFLAVLLATTLLLRHVSARVADALLAASSTDVAHLAHDPVRVLLASTLWLPGRVWLPYAVVFALALAPLERRVGPWWALAVFLSGHVVATVLTEGPIALGIAVHWLPASAAHRMDVGVSYGMYTALGAAAGLLEPRARWVALGAVATTVLVPFVLDLDLTTVGHVLSLAIGVAWWPWLSRRGWSGCLHPLRRLRPGWTAPTGEGR